MSGDPIYINPEDYIVTDESEYSSNISAYFGKVPDMAKPLIGSAKRIFKQIEKTLYSAPAFINAVRAAIPKEAYHVILTSEQKASIASGALKLMTKKDGSLAANLVNPETNKIVSTVSLGRVKLSPEITQAMTNFSTQMQMAQIAEQIQMVQIAVEEVHQGQEKDRLATAYSCQQKFLQAMAIKNPHLKESILIQLVSAAEDSRNLLMQSQRVNANFIYEQPESTWGKFISGARPAKIEARMNELRESLYAINMVSLAEALAYQEMGEPDAARLSLQYYANFLQTTYFDLEGFVERLDMLDKENYWSHTLPEIKQHIFALPISNSTTYLEENDDGTEAL